MCNTCPGLFWYKLCLSEDARIWIQYEFISHYIIITPIHIYNLKFCYDVPLIYCKGFPYIGKNNIFYNTFQFLDHTGALFVIVSRFVVNHTKFIYWAYIHSQIRVSSKTKILNKPWLFCRHQENLQPTTAHNTCYKIGLGQTELGKIRKYKRSEMYISRFK